MPRYRIPVRVIRPLTSGPSPLPRDGQAGPVKREPEAGEAVRDLPPASSEGEERSCSFSPAHKQRAAAVGEANPGPGAEGMWRDRALRLQAEMDNYRKRQQRNAQEEARAEQERLLSEFLAVADDLDRALSAADASSGEKSGLRQGVIMTRDKIARLLKKYDVERVRARGEPFDPVWHEAVGVVSAHDWSVEDGTVIEVMEAGYRRGDRLLRPARVVVAQ